MGPRGAGNVLFSFWYRCVHYVWVKLNYLLRICTFNAMLHTQKQLMLKNE